MMKYFISAIAFISMAIVLVFSPSQIFSRHDPVMIRLFNSTTLYKKSIKYLGYLLLLIGVLFIFVGVYKM
jgi:hypothetical protein